MMGISICKACYRNKSEEQTSIQDKTEGLQTDRTLSKSMPSKSKTISDGNRPYSIDLKKAATKRSMSRMPILAGKKSNFASKSMTIRDDSKITVNLIKSKQSMLGETKYDSKRFPSISKPKLQFFSRKTFPSFAEKLKEKRFLIKIQPNQSYDEINMFEGQPDEPIPSGFIEIGNQSKLSDKIKKTNLPIPDSLLDVIKLRKDKEKPKIVHNAIETIRTEVPKSSKKFTENLMTSMNETKNSIPPLQSDAIRVRLESSEGLRKKVSKKILKIEGKESAVKIADKTSSQWPGNQRVENFRETLQESIPTSADNQNVSIFSDESIVTREKANGRSKYGISRKKKNKSRSKESDSIAKRKLIKTKEKNGKVENLRRLDSHSVVKSLSAQRIRSKSRSFHRSRKRLQKDSLLIRIKENQKRSRDIRKKLLTIKFSELMKPN